MTDLQERLTKLHRYNKQVNSFIQQNKSTRVQALILGLLDYILNHPNTPWELYFLYLRLNQSDLPTLWDECGFKTKSVYADALLHNTDTNEKIYLIAIRPLMKHQYKWRNLSVLSYHAYVNKQTNYRVLVIDPTAPIEVVLSILSDMLDHLAKTKNTASTSV